MPSSKPQSSITNPSSSPPDEKEKWEPQVFRDAIIAGLEDVGSDHEQLCKYLCETAVVKFDVKRYGEIFLDVLFVGGIVAAGGAIEGGVRTDICLAKQEKSDVKSFTNILIRFIRRYKWLQKALGEEIRKIMMVMRVCLNDEERELLGSATAHLLIEGIIPPTLLSALTQDHLVKDDVSASFATSLFRTWLEERDMASLTSTLKKASLDPTLQEIYPAHKRSLDQIESYFQEKGMNELVDHVKAQRKNANRKNFISRIKRYINEEECNMTEQYIPLFTAIVKTPKMQGEFINKIQEFCYDNINFLATFNKIIFILYNGNVVEEDAIIKWYYTTHSQKGRGSSSLGWRRWSPGWRMQRKKNLTRRKVMMRSNVVLRCFSYYGIIVTMVTTRGDAFYSCCGHIWMVFLGLFIFKWTACQVVFWDFSCLC
eukprot:sb/3464956/